MLCLLLDLNPYCPALPSLTLWLIQMSHHTWLLNRLLIKYHLATDFWYFQLLKWNSAGTLKPHSLLFFKRKKKVADNQSRPQLPRAVLVMVVFPQFMTQKHHSGHPLVHKPALGLTLTRCSVPSNQAYSLLLRDMSLLSRVWVAADRMCMMSRLSRGMALSSGSYRKDGESLP